jgi:dolichyl-phosphate-mannose-protein mannosyltransferase
LGLSATLNFWGKDHRQIYLIGNPVVWWTSTAAIAIYAIFKGLAVLRWQRGFNDYSNVTFKRFDYEIGSSVLGWAFHYFPFFLMSRQLFLHHYFPALYFAIISLCQIYDFVTARISTVGLRQRPFIGQTGIILFLGVSVFAYTLYAPLTYGSPWTQQECKKVKLFSTWDWDCNTFYTSVSRISGAANTSLMVAGQLLVIETLTYDLVFPVFVRESCYQCQQCTLIASSSSSSSRRLCWWCQG